MEVRGLDILWRDVPDPCACGTQIIETPRTGIAQAASAILTVNPEATELSATKTLFFVPKPVAAGLNIGDGGCPTDFQILEVMSIAYML